MPDKKPKFDPNKSYEVVEEPSSKPKFNPNEKFSVVDDDVKKKVETQPTQQNQSGQKQLTCRRNTV
jgi:hypothetical protein